MNQSPIPSVAVDVLEQRSQRAYAAGRAAQALGAQATPAQDAACIELLQGIPVGQGVPILQAWNAGYRHQQEEQQIQEFAQQLGLVPQVTAQLVGITDILRTRLWWELFNQLPDAS